MQKASLPPPSSSDQVTNKVLLIFGASRFFKLSGYPKCFRGKMSTASLINWQTVYFLTDSWLELVIHAWASFFHMAFHFTGLKIVQLVNIICLAFYMLNS